MNKELCADQSAIEAVLTEEAEQCDARCGVCAGILYTLVTGNGTIDECSDCGMEYKRKEQLNACNI